MAHHVDELISLNYFCYFDRKSSRDKYLVKYNGTKTKSSFNEWTKSVGFLSITEQGDTMPKKRTIPVQTGRMVKLTSGSAQVTYSVGPIQFFPRNQFFFRLAK